MLLSGASEVSKMRNAICTVEPGIWEDDSYAQAIVKLPKDVGTHTTLVFNIGLVPRTV